jgi:transglutaminase-like putative cysteine protease
MEGSGAVVGPQGATYLIHQTLRYDYLSPIFDLEHRLVVIPPESHGDQRRILHRLDVRGGPAAVITHREDAFGNSVIEVRVPRVRRTLSFEVWVLLRRSAAVEWARLAAGALEDPRLRAATALTAPDAALSAAASIHLGSGRTGLELAEELNGWVHRAMRYTRGVTGVSTTAAEAFALGGGVCQDYAHVMLALCRLCGLPARYVSGHLLGEGATHAWIEVLLPDGDGAVAHAFDPTHGVRPGVRHLTVAVGRDYADVAPTSGTFRAGHSGALTARQRVTLMEGEPAFAA